MEKVEFKTEKVEEIKFGDNNFIEIASKVATTEDGDRPFLSLTRGYYKDGTDRKFVKSLTIPNDNGTTEQFVKAVQTVIAK